MITKVFLSKVVLVSDMSLSVEVNLKELYAALCPECRQKMIDIAKRSIVDDVIRKQFESKVHK